MVLTILQIIVCVLLIGAIVLQMQGSGLGGAFGGGGEMFRSRRSIEKVLMYATVVLATLFALISLLLLLQK